MMHYFIFIVAFVDMICAQSFAAILVDSRFDNATQASIRNAREHLGPNVPIYVVSSQQNIADWRKTFKNADCTFYDRIYFSGKLVGQYSALLMSASFWQAFNEEYLLIFQRDSRFCRYSSRSIKDFLGKYDYIGAPWKDWRRTADKFCQGGNGGFSLRRRQVMLDCIAKGLEKKWPEDGAFGKCLHNQTERVPTCREAAQFAVETIHHLDHPLAIHKTTRYLGRDAFILSRCPELKEV